ncbi:hypothetical protein PUL39_030330 [Pseudomonas aeruginosa]|uniref:hypothetical protein n=1 Tax=Pseudomonas aeruginosa TaxID=287 RepID=UPI0023B16F12|nr:hypothetical protein [Pseudomonas aeruginosa]MDE8660744.1 hypothetical protein [Pseudomonas aeruginosa]
MNVVPITGRLPQEQPKATHLPLCTVLTPELARCLEAVNSATRALRQAGIPIEQTSLLDRRLFIREEDLLRLHRRFHNAIRGIRQTTRGMYVTIHVVSLLGVDVAWTTPVKEQDSHLTVITHAYTPLMDVDSMSEEDCRLAPEGYSAGWLRRRTSNWLS